MSDNVFELDEVHYAYQGRFPALSGVSLAIRNGRMITLMGANGSGNSTLLALLDALFYPDRGRVSFRGKELRESDFHDEKLSMDFRRRVGLVFQNPDVAASKICCSLQVQRCPIPRASLEVINDTSPTLQCLS